MIYTVELEALKRGHTAFGSAVAALKESLATSGFVYISCPSRQQSLNRALLEQGRRFLADERAATKQRIATAPGSQKRGYYQFEAKHDTRIECFNVGRECARPELLRKRYFETVGTPEGLWAEPAARRNQFPEDPALLRPLCLEIFDVLQDLCMLVLSALELPAHQAHGHADSELEIKWYLPLLSAPAEHRVVRFDEHVDMTTLTLLVQDQLSGLQLYDPSLGDWTPACHTTDRMLCNAGMFGHMMSAGNLRAGKHRVVGSPSEPARASAVFFCTPDWDYKLPDSSMVGDHMPFQD